jgi:hypothetical protein
MMGAEPRLFGFLTSNRHLVAKVLILFGKALLRVVLPGQAIDVEVLHSTYHAKGTSEWVVRTL